MVAIDDLFPREPETEEVFGVIGIMSEGMVKAFMYGVIIPLISRLPRQIFFLLATILTIMNLFAGFNDPYNFLIGFGLGITFSMF